jgi:hypothetical protein
MANADIPLAGYRLSLGGGMEGFASEAVQGFLKPKPV